MLLGESEGPTRWSIPNLATAPGNANSCQYLLSPKSKLLKFSTSGVRYRVKRSLQHAEELKLQLAAPGTGLPGNNMGRSPVLPGLTPSSSAHLGP